MMKSITAATALCAATGLASAGGIEIAGIGGGLLMQSKDLSSLAFDTGGGQPEFNTTDLAEIHADINADISTDGCVTFILADVNVGGTTKLAFLALVDEETGVSGGGVDSSIYMTTTGNGSNLEWINDNGSDITGSLGSTFDGDFEWISAGRGDAFAWSNLVAGDVLNFRFEEVFGALATANGLSSPEFQFLSWDGSDWVRVFGSGAGAGGKYTFTSNDQFGFSATVIPLPMPALLGIAGLGLAYAARRRIAR